LGDKLKVHPNSRCLSSQQCVNSVKSIPAQYVYLNVRGKKIFKRTRSKRYYSLNFFANEQAVIGLKAVIKRDYMQTKQCKLTIAGEAPFMKQTSGWGLPKNSPYLEEFNRG
jgi:hypothetical protein